MFFHKQAKPAAAKYKIKAVLSEQGIEETAETNHYSIGETWIHVTARKLRKVRQPRENLVISMFDMENPDGPNLVAQYSKTDTHEEFKSLISDTL